MPAAARIAHGRDVIDVDAESELREGHIPKLNSLCPAHYPIQF
jgi:hypothetical protein